MGGIRKTERESEEFRSILKQYRHYKTIHPSWWFAFTQKKKKDDKEAIVQANQTS